MRNQHDCDYHVRDQGRIAYSIGSTCERLTSRAGLTVVLRVLRVLGIADWAERLFPPPGSNRGYRAGTIIETLILMFCEGAASLDEVRVLHQEQRLLRWGGLSKIPSSHTLSRWLRRQGVAAVPKLMQMSRPLIAMALRQLRVTCLTLDIDASVFHCKKKSATPTYLGRTGYTPMIGTIAETRQVVGYEFRSGHTAPAAENLDFIQVCEQAPPASCRFTRLRIDAAGYQREIIEYCQVKDMAFAIRAVMNASTKEVVQSVKAEQWQPLVRTDGRVADDEWVARKTHIMSNSEVPFELVIQCQKVQVKNKDKTKRKNKRKNNKRANGTKAFKYIYRAIATNGLNMTDSEVVMWYNMRAECSENVIRDLKWDFNARLLPCSDFGGNAAYLGMCMLAYNLFTVMQLFVLPSRFRFSRASTVRRHLIAIGGRLVSHARHWWVRVSHTHCQLLVEVMQSIGRLERRLMIPI